ncbi:MAG: cell division protein FtsL [Anaerovoracaceae bacterium]|jgi:cell division protein FtsL
MMAAEKWYEYQHNYKRYGLDMKPKQEIKKKKKVKSSSLSISAKDKARLVLLTLIIGLLGIGLIVSTAYAADIKVSINELIKENAVIQGEIENLEVKLESAANIQTIEEKAIAELGMVYPNRDQIVVMQEKDHMASKDFILAMKEQAYN